MDRTVPAGAALLLDFIGDIEAPRGYNTIYGNNQDKLRKPVTKMTVDEVLAAQPGWSRRYDSSATGRYQFMHETLGGLKTQLGLRGSQVFDGDLQDRLAYHLLKRRGFEAYMAGHIDRTEFAKRLAMEWASLPVLEPCEGQKRRVVRGQSYYAGDGRNRSLVTPERVEAVLDAVLRAPVPASAPGPTPAPPSPRGEPAPQAKPWGTGAKIWATAAALTVAGIVALFFFGGN